MLGEALRRNRRTQASVDFYRRALDQDPEKFVYYARLGGAYLLLVQHDQALEVFQRAVQRFPNLAEAHYFSGLAARGKRDYVLAEAAFRQSLVLKPDNADALAQLGFIVGERDNLAEAEQLLRRAIVVGPKHFYAHIDLGRLLVKSRRYEEALPILQEAVTLRPSNPDAHYQLFMALSRLKRKDDANRELVIFKRLAEERKQRGRDDENDPSPETGELPSASSSLPAASRPQPPQPQ